MNGICDCGYRGKLKLERFCPKCHSKVRMRMKGEIKGKVTREKGKIVIRGDKNEDGNEAKKDRGNTKENTEVD